MAAYFGIINAIGLVGTDRKATIHPLTTDIRHCVGIQEGMMRIFIIFMLAGMMTSTVLGQQNTDQNIQQPPATKASLYSPAVRSQQTVESGLPQVLIQEIRGLRRSLEDLTSKNFVLQLTIERLRNEQGALERMREREDAVQAQIDANDDLLEQLDQSLIRLNDAFNSEEEAQRRNEIDRDRRLVLNSIEKAKERAKHLESRKTDLANATRAEREKLDELERTLNALVNSSLKENSDSGKNNQ